jgi:glycosyl hydrolase family 26
VTSLATAAPRRSLLVALLPAVALTGAIAGMTSFAASASASGTTTQVLTYGASDDAYTSSARPAYNDGTVTKLVAGMLNGDSMVTYLKFKVPSLPSGTAAQKATLTLTRDEHHFPATVRLQKVADTSWTESTLTYRNAPARGTVIQSVSPAYTATSVTFDVSSVVKAAGTYSFAVTSPATNDVARLRSAEYTSDRPALKVTVAPTTTTTTTTTTSSPSPTQPAECTVNDKLVPSCNILWGAAAGGFTSTPRDQALKDWEAKTGRTANIFHTYHVGDELFPTTSEIAMASDPAAPRLLLINWKVAAGTTWARVAAGGQDKRIDTEAAYLKSHYTSKFFMVVHHEPENDVNPTAGSGMTAKDYASMYRHTVQRLRADGVSNVVFVMAYMSYEKWFNQTWWGDLYPGDDVIDWVGVDAYLTAGPTSFHNGPFSQLMDRTTSSAFPGFYAWATTKHPTKPVMLAEWGVYENTAGDYTVKPAHFDTVLPDLAKYPALKAMVYFDAPSVQSGLDSRVDSSAASLTEFKKIAADPRFNVRVR